MISDTQDDRILQSLIRRRMATIKNLIMRARDHLCRSPEEPTDLDIDNFVSKSLQTIAGGAYSRYFTKLPLLYSTAPEVILPCGFDQMRYGIGKLKDPTIPKDLVGMYDEFMVDHIFPELEKPMRDGKYLCNNCKKVLCNIINPLAIQYRTPDGVWHGMEYFISLITAGTGESTLMPEQAWIQTIVSEWQRLLTNDTRRCDALITLPDLWLPDRPFSETEAHITARCIVRELLSTKRMLHELHWRELEELLAELLHAQGFEIILTPRSSDGGRDVVARGEFIPGEPTILAIEVKQMKVVPVGELREALWANRHFPALLLATAGRFSAGLIRESKQEDTRLRLILKDGVGLTQWLDEYARHRAHITWMDIMNG